MPQRRGLDGMTALVTGGSGSIGAAVARALAADGAAVLLMARGVEKLQQARSDLLAAQPGAEIAVHAGDATSSSDVAAAAAKAHALRGRLDIVVPTMGGGGGWKPILMHDADSFRLILERNLVGTFIAVRYAAPLMTGGGSIVCLSATSAKMGIAWLAAAAAAKSGIEGFVRAAAEELASANIRVNAVRPGLTRGGHTGVLMAPGVVERYIEQIPLAAAQKRVGAPEDVAAAVRFLAGPESSWITGQSIAVDGGQELRRNPNLDDMVAGMVGTEALAAAKAGRAP